MRPIDTVYVACHAGDLWMARACVASVRAWHPDVPVVLLRDHTRRPCDTTEIERYWGVGVRDAAPGGPVGFTKLGLFLAETDERFLLLDADTVLLGPLLGALARFDADFLVSPGALAPDDPHLRGWYFDPAALRARVDPAFRYGGAVFNTGQLVGTAGRLRRTDFDPLVEWAPAPRLRHPDVFAPGEQGLLNYLLPTLEAEGRLTTHGLQLMVWPPSSFGAALDRRTVTVGPGEPYVLHWAGLKAAHPGGLPRGDLLRHYERVFYDRVPHGAALRATRELTRRLRRLPEDARNALRAAAPRNLHRAVVALRGTLRGEG